MVINTIEAKKVSEAEENVPYYLVKDDIQNYLGKISIS